MWIWLFATIYLCQRFQKCNSKKMYRNSSLKRARVNQNTVESHSNLKYNLQYNLRPKYIKTNIKIIMTMSQENDALCSSKLLHKLVHIDKLPASCTYWHFLKDRASNEIKIGSAGLYTALWPMKVIEDRNCLRISNVISHLNTVSLIQIRSTVSEVIIAILGQC